MQSNRRNFLSRLSIAALSITGLSSFKSKQTGDLMKNVFLHHVFFWLKQPNIAADADQLAAGLLKLSKVKTIQQFHIGKPADTNRDVVDKGYGISWLVVFKNAADEESYQTDPIHLKFIEECAHLWSKVVVYDSVDK